MAWYDEAVFYHIYPLGLCGAPKENTYKYEANGKESGMAVLMQWIGHMQELGITALYIGPLFESGTHGYDTTDYRKVDSRLGTNEEFAAFVQACHKANIRVVVDGVFNHTGRDFFAFRNLLEQRENSWGKDWYCNVNFGGNSPFGDGFSYDSWHGYAQLPRLNMWNPAVKDYLLEAVRFWADTFDIDGIRLDCADVLDFDFMYRLRALAETVKPEFWLMGEVIHGDYGQWVNQGPLHSVTNYELHKGIYSAHNSHNYFEMAHTLRRLFDPSWGLCKGARLYNFVDNHDVDRIYNKLSQKEHLYPVYAFLFTAPGIPSIYYGSEWGMEGRQERGSDDALRPAIDIRTFESPHPKLTAFITKLAHLHTSCPEFIYGEYRELVLTTTQYVYARIYDGRAGIVLLNNEDKEARVTVKLPFADRPCENLFSGETLQVYGDRLEMAIPENGAIVLRQ